MNLATRCAGCGTLFRVVQDQLKVADGWVRCGRCDAVFDASASLFDLGADADADADGDAGAELAAGGGAGAGRDDEADRSALPSPGSVGIEARAPVPDVAHRELDAPPPAGFDAPFDLAFPEPPSPVDASTGSATHEPETAELLAPVDPPALPTRHPPGIEAADEPGAGRPAGTDRPPVATDANAVTSAADASPAFMPGDRWTGRRRRSGERRGGRAFAWGAVGFLLMLLLALQASFQARETLAARWPVLLPPFASACRALGCTLGPPRRIDAIAVESTALALTALPGAYRLSVGLRNRGDLPVAVPSIELTLTDTDGRLLARRVLATADFVGAPAAAIDAGGERPLQALVAVPGGRVSGYTVEIFYP